MTLLLAALMPALILIGVAGCGEDTTSGPTPRPNPNVKSFDSIGVVEDSAAFQSYTGIDLLLGTTTLDTARNRDCSLNDQNNTGMNFYLQNGELDNLLPAGYEIRFFSVSSDMSATAFDTLSKVPGYDSLRAIDFTQNSTEFWGYFNAPLSSTPVYCFWLKGKKDFGVTVRNVFGIIQPREATDNNPGNVYGFRISFRVRINTNGDNDFRKTIITD